MKRNNLFIYTVLFLFTTMFHLKAAQDHATTTEQALLAKPASLVAVDYIPPSLWQLSRQDDLVIYTAPEQDAVIVITKIDHSLGAEVAAMTALKQYSPSFARALRVNMPRVKAGGWDRIRQINYDSTVNEGRMVTAYVHQKQQDGYVILMDGNIGTIEKRLAALRTLIGSFKLTHYQAEDLSKRSAQPLSPTKVDALVHFVKASASQLNIPGVGLAIVENGKVVFEGGVGVTDFTDTKPVTKDTRFMIASNTKGMTTLLLAKLVEMGKIGWADPVVRHYPQFKLGDQQTTERVLIKHLVCACTGLPRKDSNWMFNNEPDSPVEIAFSDLATTIPTSNFGELYQYNNQMTAAAGYIAAHLLYPELELGAGYDKAMQKFIFAPLKMQHTTFAFAEALQADFAAPHGENLFSQLELIPQTQTTGVNHLVTPYRPAGGAWSSASDMIKYVQNELSVGIAPSGERLFLAEPLLKRREASVSTGQDANYGMGLATRNINGINIIEHGGAMPGYRSNIVVIPGANVGAVILTNADAGGYLLAPFTRRLVELLFDAEALAENQVAVMAEMKALNAKTLQNELTYPPAPQIVRTLAKHYYSEELGDLVITQVGQDVILDPGVWQTAIATKVNSDGSISLVTIAPFLLGAEFIVANSDGLRSLVFKDAQHSYRFTEVLKTTGLNTAND